jgi:putative ABC transport system ATP-binding protein
MDKTREIVEKNNISTLMITHNLQDAINYGNRLIMLHEGEILIDVRGDEKKNLTSEKLLRIFNKKEAGLKDSELFSA